MELSKNAIIYVAIILVSLLTIYVCYLLYKDIIDVKNNLYTLKNTVNEIKLDNKNTISEVEESIMKKMKEVFGAFENAPQYDDTSSEDDCVSICDDIIFDNFMQNKMTEIDDVSKEILSSEEPEEEHSTELVEHSETIGNSSEQPQEINFVQDNNTCIHLTKKGNACKKQALPGEKLCKIHSRN